MRTSSPLKLVDKLRELSTNFRHTSAQISLCWKLVQGLPRDGLGLIRRGRPLKVTLDAPTMADAVSCFDLVDLRQLARGRVLRTMAKVTDARS